jgi:light-regulated signal transduction histidine kinase (bacteriophytochrome)
MKLKIKYLIWGCLLVIPALTAIQGYFIYNTFILKEREAQTAVRAELIKMEEQIQIDKLRDSWFEQMEILVRENRLSEINKLIRDGSAAISRQVSIYIGRNLILDQYHTAYEVMIKNAVLITFFQIAIMDNGIGIAKDEFEKIFGKFYRVEKGDIHTVKGLGLGLFYSQQLITAHGGRISLQSLRHSGTTFTITLPLK